jgi:hypothetical protein
VGDGGREAAPARQRNPVSGFSKAKARLDAAMFKSFQ